MILEKRMQGSIDQIDGFVYFGRQEVLPSWDQKIETLCASVNALVEKISTIDPDWTAKFSEQIDNQMMG
jgi:COP9 signalosome complex subunit 4